MSKASRISASVSAQSGLPAGHALLTTKLQLPSIGGQPLVARRALASALDADLPLTIITAPPGSGKTTLLAEWIAARARPVAWLALDELDNDVQRFLAYVCAAVCDEFVPEGASPEALLAQIIRDLAALPLVIDDYHVISNAAIHEAVAFLIDHLPPGGRLIIAGRTRPPLPLARLRANGRLAEIDDLRFTAEETAAFFAQSEIAPDDAAGQPTPPRPKAGSPVCGWRRSGSAAAATLTLSTAVTAMSTITFSKKFSSRRPAPSSRSCSTRQSSTC